MIQGKGYTLIELMIALAIMATLVTFGAPALDSFLVKANVDNQVLTLQRLLLLARNSAVNLQQTVTFCPLDNKNCTTQWHNELSVFIDSNNNKVLEANLGERVLATKEEVTDQYTLQYGTTRNGITYSPTGNLSGWGQNGTFSYCPNDYMHLSRGITVATSGRLYLSSDNNAQNIDKNRNGIAISCR